MKRAVDRAQRPPMHQPSASSSSPAARSVSRTAQCSSSQTNSASPISESSSSGTPQSTRKTSNPPRGQELDEQLPRRRSKISGRLISANTRTGTGARESPSDSGRASSRVRPDDVTGCLSDRRVRCRQDYVSRARTWRAACTRASPDRAHDDSRVGLGRASAPALGDPSSDGPRKVVAQLLHLLQEALQLVLGSMELLGEPSHVRPPGEAQIPQHEIGEIRADPCGRGDVLGAARRQHAEARLRTSSSNACAVRDSACSPVPEPGPRARECSPWPRDYPPAPERPRSSLQAQPSPPGRGAS